MTIKIKELVNFCQLILKVFKNKTGNIRYKKKKKNKKNTLPKYFIK